VAVTAAVFLHAFFLETAAHSGCAFFDPIFILIQFGRSVLPLKKSLAMSPLVRTRAISASGAFHDLFLLSRLTGHLECCQCSKRAFCPMQET
jgi:hypothetical protein